ncbi:MAG: vitamin K epoxide reductase family protein [Candidatus Dormiibacterota bacterium]|jgi:uncharacterized membrane protein
MVPQPAGEGAPPQVSRSAAGSEPPPWGALLLAALAGIGIGLAAYLTSVHYAGTPLICSDKGFVDCELVLSSAYSVIPGTSVPITVPGMAYFLVSLVLALAQLRRPGNYGLRQAHAAWAGLGLLTAFYLIFVEFVDLRTLCLWCTSVHVVILLTLLITIWRLYPAPDSGVQRGQ